ncbi:MAG: hypothetical protein GY925_16770 [Actinomycetia bacterium]|nr:hypothetical protein [Actinomycetes bacterium]
MIALELSFTSTQERLSARPEHRKILEQLHTDGTLIGAGPWADDSGALLIFDADREAVDRIIADDPYYRTQGVTIASVRDWTPIVGPR